MTSTISRILLSALTGLIFVSLMVTGGCEYITGEATDTTSPDSRLYDVTAVAAWDIIQENAGNPDFIILDVRTPEEYQEGHLNQAINIDYYSEEFRERLEALDKEKTYLVYCRSGRRSAAAIDLMTELNFREVYHASGGFLEWEAEGFPVVP